MGSLIRLAVIAVLVFLAYRFVRGLLKQNEKPSTVRKEEKLIACEVCQLRLPEAEAVKRHGHYYCEKHDPENG